MANIATIEKAAHLGIFDASIALVSVTIKTNINKHNKYENNAFFSLSIIISTQAAFLLAVPTRPSRSEPMIAYSIKV